METLLNLTIFLPLIGLLGILLVRSNETLVKWVSLVTTLATFALSVPLMLNFDAANGHTLQFLTEGGRFVFGLDIRYLVGLDGLSLLLFMLTTFMGPIVVLSAWDSVHKHAAGFFAMLMLLQTGSLGVFAAMDAVLFYVFFELSLIPMYFLIGIWGGDGRIAATVKFFVYTLVGSLIMLVALIYVGYDAGVAVNEGVFTSDLRVWTGDAYAIGLAQQTALFLAFALAFCIKVPLFPFHTWLPFAHTEAPTAGSVVLAAIMLKMGTYGLIRFCLPMFPNAAEAFAPMMATLAVIGIVYGALVAMVQKDVKKLVAYSSVSHLGFVVLGIFAMNVTAVQGAVIQNINHGLSTGALFLLVGMIYDRRHTRLIADFGGIAGVMPKFAVMFMIATFSSIGLPGLNGFVGEFLILMGAFQSTVLSNIWFAVIGTTGVILAAVYMLWMVQRVFFGEVTNEENQELSDLDTREVGLLLPVMIFIVWIGIYPTLFTGYSESHIHHTLERSKAKGEQVAAAARTQTNPAWVATLYGLHDDLASK
jgi:NADH-quinone oxidoreductase subunit M